MSSLAVDIDRFRGCMLLGAAGDALGYPVEFLSASAIRAKFDSATPTDVRLADGARLAVVSDDTQMTLFTAEALSRATTPSSRRIACFHAYQRWLSTQEMDLLDATPWFASSVKGTLLSDPRLYVRRAPGSTCLSALRASRSGASMGSVDEPPNDSKGCGAIMRSAPFGLVASSREEAFESAIDAAVLTHGHPSGYFSAAAFAALVFDIARDVPFGAALDHADSLLTGHAKANETRTALKRGRAIGDGGLVSVREIESLGGGWVGEEALAIAVACVASRGEETLLATLWRSVFHGGDSDSTGSLVGNLIGAMEGTARMPESWIAELDVGDLVDTTAKALRASIQSLA